METLYDIQNFIRNCLMTSQTVLTIPKESFIMRLLKIMALLNKVFDFILN